MSDLITPKNEIERIRQYCLTHGHLSYRKQLKWMADEVVTLAEKCDAKDAEIERLRHYNESVAVCEKHTPDVIKGDCLVCEIERYKGLCDKWEAEYAEQKAEIERLNKRHDDFLQEFWATNAMNAKLQAVVDAADRVYADYEDDCNIQSSWRSLGQALAMWREADDV